MTATNPYTHDIWVSCAIEDVTDLRTVCDSLCNNGTPIVCEEQEVLGACETARQGAIEKGSVHLDRWFSSGLQRSFESHTLPKGG